jgi:hypothetical protein
MPQKILSLRRERGCRIHYYSTRVEQVYISDLRRIESTFRHDLFRDTLPNNWPGVFKKKLLEK